MFFYVKDETQGEHPDDAHALSIGDVDVTASQLKRLVACVGDGSKVSKDNVLHPDDDKICTKINIEN